MKHLFLILSLFILHSATAVCSSKADSLLIKLDKVIAERSTYVHAKNEEIEQLKRQKNGTEDVKTHYLINREIISLYNTFICDSAERYITENLAIAEELNDDDLLIENRLRLSNIYSLSGLFIQASDIFASIDYDALPTHYKAWYCWNYIRYYENLIFYTDDHNFVNRYEKTKESYRDKVMEMLPEDSDEYQKELAHKLQLVGKYTEAVDILMPVFLKQDANTHLYAMSAMNLAKVYKQEKNSEKEEHYLTLAAITDIQLAVKDNEALLSLAIILYNKGDINRAYDYIRVALDDALFYNTRFKNAVIARVQPIIEETYLQKIKSQQNSLEIYAVLISLSVVILVVLLIYIYKQKKAVSEARKQLLSVNRKLDEANMIKEKYLGYFMNQCSVYINKLHLYRKNVHLKIKTNQLENLLKSPSADLEKDINELRTNFDKAFLNVYPDFISEFNLLLRPDERFELDAGELNTELRIFALIKLGITDVSRIADFLRYSVQTVYNYKSRVKGKSLIESDMFENEVRKLCKFH